MTLPRLARAQRAHLDAQGARLFDELAVLDGVVGADGALNGPFNAMLLAPQLGRAMQGFGAAIRAETAISTRLRELAILTVAAYEESSYIRFAHEPVAVAAGVPQSDVAAVATGRPVSADDTERAALGVVARLLRDGDLADEAHRSAVAALGERTLFELSVIVGYYRLIALQLRLFGVSAPAADADGAR